MGAHTIKGSFSSSDWNATIKQIVEKSKIYVTKPDGTKELDHVASYYAGTLYSIENWNFYEAHNKSEKEIDHELMKYCPTKHSGRIFEGPQVGYDLIRPQFEKINSRLPNYQQYFEKGLRGCVLLEELKMRDSSRIYVAMQDSYEKCISRAESKLWFSPEKTLIICDASGKLTKCYTKSRRVKETTQQPERYKLHIRPVYNYYYIAMVAC